jgi:hypothetical protein
VKPTLILLTALLLAPLAALPAAGVVKLPANQLFDLRRDPDCMTNLAATVSFAALQKQLFDELRQQGDPRLLGNRRIFDEYPYGNPSARNFYTRGVRGVKPAAD